MSIEFYRGNLLQSLQYGLWILQLIIFQIQSQLDTKK